MYGIPRHRLYDKRWSGKKTRLANYRSNCIAFAFELAVSIFTDHGRFGPGHLTNTSTVVRVSRLIKPGMSDMRRCALMADLSGSSGEGMAPGILI